MSGVEHSVRKHALLSASGASRWLNCTPSARLEEKFEMSHPSSSSAHAQEGTLAHEMSELMLREAMDEMTHKQFVKEMRKIENNPLYSPEMDTEVAKYVSFVMEAFAVAKAETTDAVLLIEQKLDYSHVVEQGFGTGDAMIIADGTMHIIDLKYGKGIQVYAAENSQLKLYGLGGLRRYEALYDINNVRLSIVQPRLNHFDTWDISVTDIKGWAENVVKPKAVMAYKGEGEQIVGEHCKWCKVKAMCSAMAQHNIELAKGEFKEPSTLSDERILEIYKQIPMLVDWANAVESYILSSALNGKTWPGYKLVEGRSIRKWCDEDTTVQWLEKKGFDKEQIMKSSLLGIPAIEKLVGKELIKDLQEFVITPEGKPTLAKESDRRPAIGSNSAACDFA